MNDVSPDPLTTLREQWFDGVEPGPWHPAHRAGGPIVLDNANGDSLFVDAADAAALVNALESATLSPDHTHDPETCVGCANSMAMAFESGFRSGIIEAKNRLSRAGMHDGKCPEPDKPCACGLDAAIDGEGFTP